MPPCLDVYALSPRRDRAMLETFLARYADEPPRSDVQIEELMVLPANFTGDEDELQATSDWDWIGATSLDDAWALGLRQPWRAFRVYLAAVGALCGAVVGFTSDGQVIFGVSVDDPFETPEARAEAERTLADLVALTQASRGWVVVEEPPPLNPERKRPWENAIMTSTAE